MRNKFCSTLLTLTFISTLVFGQSKSVSGFEEVFKGTELSKYQPLSFLKPSNIESDFNGDGTKDIAILIIQKTTKKRGILIILGNSNQHFIFGAGTKFGNGSDDFKWLKEWGLYKDKIAHETTFTKDGDILSSKKINLLRPALYVHDLEDGLPLGGGLIYWTGKKYIWIHQGE